MARMGFQQSCRHNRVWSLSLLFWALLGVVFICQIWWQHALHTGQLIHERSPHPWDQTKQNASQNTSSLGSVGVSPSSLTLAEPPLVASIPTVVAEGVAKMRARNTSIRLDPNQPMTSFILEGGRFPIVVLAHNRAERLRQTLLSLRNVRGFSSTSIFVAQDGDDADVSRVVEEHGLENCVHIQDLDQIKRNFPQRWEQNAVRIARHYKWAFNQVFNKLDKLAPGVIILEDDLLFSPDFLEYFHAVAPLLELDKSLWVASAWNDNGFDYLVHDVNSLLRTDFMPGLGWLMPRKLWEAELASKWPDKGWDHWMREPNQHSGREVVFPQVPRVFHNGSTGTFMDEPTHNRYFARIATHSNTSVVWSLPSPGGVSSDGHAVVDRRVAQVASEAYEQRVREELQKAIPVRDAQDIAKLLSGTPTSLALWVSYDLAPRLNQATTGFDLIAAFFGLWHEPRRGAHRGLHEFWLGDTHMFLINVHPSLGQSGIHHDYTGLQPPDVIALKPSAFRNLKRLSWQL